MSWLTGPVVGLVVRRTLPVLLGAAIGLLGDAELLDGTLVAALQAALSASR